MHLKWDTSHALGIKEIDEQHKRFFGILNEVHGVIDKKKDRKEIKKILLELIDYAVIHFRTEEKYFDKFGFEDSVAHKKAHLSLSRKLGDFFIKFEKNEQDLDRDLVGFLEEWLRDHIDTEDKKFAKCFREHGLD